MGIFEWGFRLTPRRTTIVMKNNPLAADPSANYKTRSQAGDIAAKQLGMRQDGDDADVLMNEFGQPIVDRELAYLPDPRFSNGAHWIFGLLWYGGCVASILYIVWTFLVYEPEQTVTVPTMATLDPAIPLSLMISCSWPTEVQVRVNYSLASSPCYNASAANVSTIVGVAPVPIALVPPAPGTTMNVNASLCYTPQSIFGTSAAWDEVPVGGISLHFAEISKIDVCTVDVYSRLPKDTDMSSANTTAKPIKRLNVEGRVFKTLFLGYTEKRLKHEDKALAAQRVYPMFYELDGVRVHNGGTSSVVQLRLADTANAILEYDMRSWVKAGGIFGTLWYMVSAYFCFWAAPLLLAFMPRDIFADSKAGKLDGYTKDGLGHCWRPTVWLWIGGALVKRITHAVSP